MKIPKRYNPRTSEPKIQVDWQETAVYHFNPDSDALVYSIDTPPPTVSGKLHLGHVYSYSHADFIARFWRMNGRNVYYPMGFDDNGLPTERLVERTLGIQAADVGRETFIQKCLEVSKEAEVAYETLWRRLGLSIDWRYTYRSIDENSRRTAQHAFLRLLKKDLAYQQQAPSIYCPECQTAIAQAELDDLERDTNFYELDFRLEDGESLPIATTRPELLPACVAVFVHPSDGRYTQHIGKSITTPLFGKQVPLLADPGADPDKGTGAVMCCTFGDTADVAWWRSHKLPLIEAIGQDGNLTKAAGAYAGLSVSEARKQIVQALDEKGQLLGKQPVSQTVRIHERCDTPVEYIVTKQWFIRVLDFKEELLEAGDQLNWHPAHMQARYSQWVANLGWDWCITRQRTFGVPFPIWYCDDCGETILADASQLPIDPNDQQPNQPCTACGGTQATPEKDVMDTWATSSLSPQIAGRWLSDEALYQRVAPFTLRPQAHDIIRTWAFYTIVQSLHHFGTLPWQDVFISGHGLAPEGKGKLSKSRGGGPDDPLGMIELHSADAVRYWTASTSPGKDAIINEDKIKAGAKLVTKLWNVTRFSQRFFEEGEDGDFSTFGWGLEIGDYVSSQSLIPNLQSPISNLQSPADRWILARTQQVISRVTAAFEGYDYAAAKNEIEQFFYRDLADNYLEMAKQRLYEGGDAANGTRFALYQALLTVVKLFAPLLPHVTERIYQAVFAESDGAASVHRASWPVVLDVFVDETAVSHGTLLLEIATAVRRYKSEQNIGLGTELTCLHLATSNGTVKEALTRAKSDLISITRARQIAIGQELKDEGTLILRNNHVQIAISQ